MSADAPSAAGARMERRRTVRRAGAAVSRYRVWPAAVLASLGAAGAVAVGLSATASEGEGCPEGQQWAAVTTLPSDSLMVDYRTRFTPLLTGCLNVDELTPLGPTEIPDPRS